jgi:hypothetical protein
MAAHARSRGVEAYLHSCSGRAHSPRQFATIIRPRQLFFQVQNRSPDDCRYRPRPNLIDLAADQQRNQQQFWLEPRNSKGGHSGAAAAAAQVKYFIQYMLIVAPDDDPAKPLTHWTSPREQSVRHQLHRL